MAALWCGCVSPATAFQLDWGRCIRIENEQQRIAEHAPAAQDYFGNAIALRNGLLATGSFLRDNPFFNSGQACLLDADTGQRIRTLAPSDPGEDAWFGYDIDMDDHAVVVSAVMHDAAEFNAGAAYVFDLATGTQRHRLLPEPALPQQFFGDSVAIADGLIAVGAVGDETDAVRSGAVYLFDAQTGTQLHRLHPADGATFDQFGTTVRLHNGLVLVGADSHAGRGALYLFDAETGVQLTKLMPDWLSEGDRFGFSFAAEGDLLAVSTVGDDGLGFDAGAVHLYQLSTLQLLRTTRPLDGAPEELFGWSIDLDHGVLAVGTYLSLYVVEASGSAYLFEADTGDMIAKLLPSSPTEHDNFGIALDLDGDTLAVSAWGDGNDVEQGGALYRFDLPEPECPADVNRDDILDLADIHTFVELYNQQTLEVDMTCDQLLNLGDIVEFVESFLGGC